jgi:hypothetical protein
VIANAQALADQLMKGGLDIVTGGTDTHVMLVDLRPKGVKGNATEKALGRAHITCNKNGIPFDTEKPTITSGVRLGSPAGTTRGFGEAEFRQIGDWIVEVVDWPPTATSETATGGAEGDGTKVVLRTCATALSEAGAMSADLPARPEITPGYRREADREIRAFTRDWTATRRPHRVAQLFRNLRGYFFTLWLTVLAWPSGGWSCR